MSSAALGRFTITTSQLSAKVLGGGWLQVVEMGTKLRAAMGKDNAAKVMLEAPDLHLMGVKRLPAGLLPSLLVPDGTPPAGAPVQ